LERVLHAAAFEMLATLICAPVLGWVMGMSFMRMGALTIAISLIAMTWNMAFNALFDHAQHRIGFARTPRVRVLHALLFEVGLAAVTVPLTAWWLGIGLWPAFLLDASLLLFFLPYSVAFNWAYDVLRERWVLRRTVAQPD